MWTDDWIGLPYRPAGRGPAYDCMGLWLALTQARGGAAPPDPACTEREALRRRTAVRLRPWFARVETAHEGDLLLFRSAGRLLHVGYALGPADMLHTESHVGHSLIERHTDARWRDRLEGVYRCLTTQP